MLGCQFEQIVERVFPFATTSENGMELTTKDLQEFLDGITQVDCKTTELNMVRAHPTA